MLSIATCSYWPPVILYVFDEAFMVVSPIDGYLNFLQFSCCITANNCKQFSCCITALNGLLLSHDYMLTSCQSGAWSFAPVISFDSPPNWEWHMLVSPFYRRGWHRLSDFSKAAWLVPSPAGNQALGLRHQHSLFGWTSCAHCVDKPHRYSTLWKSVEWKPPNHVTALSYLDHPK